MSLEPIQVLASQDWLQREAVELLMDDIIARRFRRIGGRIDVDEDVGQRMPSARRAA
jgi:hypothetical protein